MSLRLTEAEYAALVRRSQPVPPVLAEAVFQAAVVQLAKDCGWLVYFTKNSHNSPSGYPDLTLAKAGQPLYICELKREDGQVTKAQAAWLEALGQCTGVVADIWRPAQLQEIVERLRG
jgi:hypothetical protein